jgi:hypothetical protein
MTASSIAQRFRLLPELDEMQRQISDLELEQTRLEAARARAARRETARVSVEKALRDADEAHALAASEHLSSSRKTAAELEEERQAALRCATSAEESFAAEYEAAFSVEQLRELLRREEGLIQEGSLVSEEARRFAHFTELGAISSPVAQAAIYHLWDVDARNQPCRCASCGVILLLKKQYIGDKLVDVFCAKCTAAHHRDEVFRQSLSLQEFYLARTAHRIDERFRGDFDALMEEEEPRERRALQVEERLQREIVFEVLFKKGPQPKGSSGAAAAMHRKVTGFGVL